MQSSTNPTEMSDKQDLPAEEDKRGLSRRRILTTAVAGGAVIAGGGLTNVANAKPRPPRNELVEVEALELSKLIKNRSVSCVEVMETFLAHIHRYNPRVNAIINLIDDGILLQQAAERDRQLRRGQYLGWMHGFPHAVKESTQVKGLPWTQGSPVHRDRVGTTDSRSVAQMRAAGALIIGNTNLPEFALGSNSYNPIYGRTGSAFAPSRTSGGSSGGAASALGLRMVPVADGGDYMGSLRNPAAFNNVLGYRPSYGRISSGGFIAQAGASGPMARNVRDLIALLQTWVGPTGRNPMELTDDPSFLDKRLERSFRGTRIAWMGDFDGYLATDPGLLTVCEKSFKTFASIGVEVEPVSPEFDMPSLWDTWLKWRGLAQVGRYELWKDPAKRRLMKPEANWEVEMALKYTALDISRADGQRTDWYAAVMKIFDEYDFILAPSTQVFPFDKNINWPKSIDGRRMDTYHRWMETVMPWSLTQLPNMGMPAGFNSAGLPVGIQLIGQDNDDLSVLQLSYAYEKAAGLNKVLPPLLKAGGQH